MKRKISFDLIAFFILIPVILSGAFFISSKMNSRTPDYSIINNGKNGCSVFYKALKELSYPVERSLKKIDPDTAASINIIPAGGTFNINDPNVENWISKGGSLVYLTSENLHLPIYKTTPVKKGEIDVYKYKKGEIIVLDVSFVTNKKLMTSTDTAYKLLVEIDSFINKKILFNEAYLYSDIKPNSLWDYIPMKIKFVLYQMLLVLGAFFYYKGKRFGRPAVFYEESERTENEYLYSAASLYRHAKCWDLMLENYYKGFLKNFKSPDSWLKEWEQEGLPHHDKAEELHAFIEKRDAKYKSKEYLQTVKLIEELTNILHKRRDSYWKRLKKT